MLKPKAALLVGCLLATLVPMFPQAGRKHPAVASNEEIGKTIQRLENDLRLAILKPDLGWLEVHLSEGYTDIDPQGKVLKRADLIQALKNGDVAYDVMNLSEGTAAIFNADTVFLVQKEEVQGGLKDKNFSGVYRCSHLWIKQDGEWQLAATQWTPIPGEAPKTR